MSRVTLDTSELNRLLRESDNNSQETINAIAFSVEAKAKVKAPVDTGALKNSIQTVTPSRQSQGGDEIIPNPERLHAHVGSSMEYAIYQELGTRNMQAQPFLIPALTEVEEELRRNPSILRGIINE